MILSKTSNNNWTPTASGTGTFIGTLAAFNAIKDTLPVNTVAYITDDGNGDLQPVDAVTNGDMHPVTSNAVYDKLATQTSTITIDTSVFNVNSWFTLRRSGNVVTLTGRCWKEEQMVTPNMTVIGHVPEGFRPLTDTYFTCHMFDANKTQFMIYINSVGDIMTAGAGATSSRIDFYVNMSWII